MPSVVKNPRRMYLESTVAYRRHLMPASTRCLQEVSSVAPSAMGSSAWWEPRFPEPMQPLMPGMKPISTTGGGQGIAAVGSPWDHPPTRTVGSQRAALALLETPARCPTPHYLRHYRAPRARGSRWVLEGVIKNRSRSVMNDVNMSGNYPIDGEERFKRLHLPPLRPAAVYAYNKNLRQRGFG